MKILNINTNNSESRRTPGMEASRQQAACLSMALGQHCSGMNHNPSSTALVNTHPVAAHRLPTAPHLSTAVPKQRRFRGGQFREPLHSSCATAVRVLRPMMHKNGSKFSLGSRSDGFTGTVLQHRRSPVPRSRRAPPGAARSSRLALHKAGRCCNACCAISGFVTTTQLRYNAPRRKTEVRNQNPSSFPTTNTADRLFPPLPLGEAPPNANAAPHRVISSGNGTERRPRPLPCRSPRARSPGPARSAEAPRRPRPPPPP